MLGGTFTRSRAAWVWVASCAFALAGAARAAAFPLPPLPDGWTATDESRGGAASFVLRSSGAEARLRTRDATPESLVAQHLDAVAIRSDASREAAGGLLVVTGATGSYPRLYWAGVTEAGLTVEIDARVSGALDEAQASLLALASALTGAEEAAPAKTVVSFAKDDPRPEMIFTGSFSLEGSSGFMDLILYEDGTARRTFRPGPGARDLRIAAQSDKGLVLEGARGTFRYRAALDASGEPYFERQRLRPGDYERAYLLPALPPGKVPTGRFQRGQAGQRVTLALDGGRFEVSPSFWADAARSLSGRYEAAGYDLVLIPDKGPPARRTVVVREDGEGGRTLYLDGEVWLGDVALTDAAKP